MTAPHSEDGFTVVELVVACMMMAIVTSMTYLIATTMVKQTVMGTAAGVSSESAQSTMTTIDGYLRGAISPANTPVVYGTSLCSGAGSSSTPAQAAYDYYLELCSAPPRRSTLTCTAANASTSATACPQLYLIYVDLSTCSTTYNECTLKITDLSVSSKPTVFSSSVLRCPSTCQGDLGSTSAAPAHHETTTSPSFPYLFTYYDGTGTAQIDGSSLAAVQSIHVDLQVLNTPPVPAGATQKYTEMTDGVWLTGAAAPQT